MSFLLTRHEAVLGTTRRKFYSAEDVSTIRAQEDQETLVDALLFGHDDRVEELVQRGETLADVSDEKCEHLLFDIAVNGDLERFAKVVDMLQERTLKVLTSRVMQQIIMWREDNMLIYLGYRGLLKVEHLTLAREVKSGVKKCTRTIESFLRTGRPATP